MDSIIAVHARTRGLVTALIIIVTVTAVQTTARVAMRAAVLRGAAMVINMVGGVSVMVTWWQVGTMSGQ